MLAAPSRDGFSPDFRDEYKDVDDLLREVHPTDNDSRYDSTFPVARHPSSSSGGGGNSGGTAHPPLHVVRAHTVFEGRCCGYCHQSLPPVTLNGCGAPKR